jgi:hypothetical protein
MKRSKQATNDLRFEVYTVMNLQAEVFWVVTLYSAVVGISFLEVLVILKMEAAWTSETLLVFYSNTTQHNTAHHNTTRHDTTQHDTTRHDTASLF